MFNFIIIARKQETQCIHACHAMPCNINLNTILDEDESERLRTFRD